MVGKGESVANSRQLKNSWNCLSKKMHVKTWIQSKFSVKALKTHWNAKKMFFFYLLFSVKLIKYFSIQSHWWFLCMFLNFGKIWGYKTFLWKSPPVKFTFFCSNKGVMKRCHATPVPWCHETKVKQRT